MRKPGSDSALEHYSNYDIALEPVIHFRDGDVARENLVRAEDAAEEMPQPTEKA